MAKNILKGEEGERGGGGRGGDRACGCSSPHLVVHEPEAGAKDIAGKGGSEALVQGPGSAVLDDLAPDGEEVPLEAARDAHLRPHGVEGVRSAAGQEPGCTPDQKVLEVAEAILQGNRIFGLVQESIPLMLYQIKSLYHK